MNRAAEPRTEPRMTEAAVASAPDDDLPVTVLEPQAGWRLLDLAELWRYRELLVFLTWRDVQIRYKQTVLGAAWAVLQPVATMLVLALLFGRVAAKPAGDVPYPLFLFAGLLPWTFFATAIGSAGQSIVGGQNLVTKVYFPRLIIPIAAVGAALVDFAIAFGVLVLLMLGYRTFPGAGFLLVPVLFALIVTTAVGVGTLLSALTVSYRDFRHAVPFLVQFWMFATPSIFLQDDSAVPAAWQWVFPLNPLYGLIRNFRAAALGGSFDLYSLAVSGAIGLVLLLFGCLYFRRVERSFADVI